MAAKSLGASLALAVLVVLLPARQALADVIDGDWCSPEGRHITIKGPQIVTPSGSHLQGSYSRHAFTYVVPQADPGAGETVAMILINEETMNLRAGADAAAATQAPVQVWHRCAPAVSFDERSRRVDPG